MHDILDFETETSLGATTRNTYSLLFKMAGSDGAFKEYLRIFKVREELEAKAKAKKEAEQDSETKLATPKNAAEQTSDESSGALEQAQEIPVA